MGSWPFCGTAVLKPATISKRYCFREATSLEDEGTPIGLGCRNPGRWERLTRSVPVALWSGAMSSPSSLLSLGLIAALSSAGCLSIEKKHLGSPFLVSKSQGLQKGQTKSQVLSALGAPWCIEPDPDHLSRELYVY